MRRIIFKILRWGLVLLEALVILFVLFVLLIVEENWRGKCAWEQCKRDLEAKGEHLDLAYFIPPPIPDEQNFAKTPLLKSLLDYKNDPVTKMAIFDEPDPPVGKIRVDIKGSDITQPKASGWMIGQHADLQAWQTYYRTALPGMAHAPSPAEDVIAVLGKFDGMLSELKEAANTRPLSRFSVKYEEGYATVLSHGNILQKITRVLALRATAELSLNHPDEAFADIQFGFRLVDSIQQEPILISGLIRISMINLLMQPVWEGITTHRWSDGQLAKLEFEFQRIDFLSDFIQGIRTERAVAIMTMTQLLVRRDLMRQLLMTANLGDHPILSRLYIKGWFEQNMVFMSRSTQELILSVDSKKQLVNVARVIRENNEVRDLFATPYSFLEKSTLPVLSNVSQKYFQAQIYIDEAAIACAIERYQLIHYALPATLDDLHIASLPHDIINGQPLHYRLVGDDNYVLYSVGWNGTDEGGKLGKTESGSLDPKQSDWVWSLKPL